jgi:tRNA pseudouridine55 synthase
MTELISKLILIDKPKGMSSFSVIRQLRRRTGMKKFGHAGTLDPLATGLMIVGVNKATKLLAGIIGLDKEYEAQILLGEKRATGDMEGEILTEALYQDNLSEEQINIALQELCGEVELPVSAYSAIKRDGVPMYKKARKAAQKGELVADVPIRMMKVYSAKLFGVEEILVDGKKRLLLRATFFVGSGTYIRSLAEELGNKLNYPATLYNLRRTKVGEFDIKDAVAIDEVIL